MSDDIRRIAPPSLDPMQERFPSTGMMICEAISRASRWWDITGRHLVKQDSNVVEVGRKVRKGFVMRGENIPEIRSGILMGLPWDRLDRLEQSSVVQHWHREFVEKADLEGAAMRVLQP
jgi:hypothetical protein